MRKTLLQAAIAALTIASATPLASAQVIGDVEVNVDDVELTMNDRSSITAEQSNSSGVNKQSAGQVVIAPTGAGFFEVNIEGGQFTMNDDSSIDANQENSGGWSVQCVGQLTVC